MPTALITGATAGIGKSTATALARKGWKIIVHGRNAATCEVTARAIRLETGNSSIPFAAADLSQVASAASS